MFSETDTSLLTSLSHTEQGALWEKLWLQPAGHCDGNDYPADFPALVTAAAELVGRLEFDWDASYRRKRPPPLFLYGAMAECLHIASHLWLGAWQGRRTCGYVVTWT